MKIDPRHLEMLAAIVDHGGLSEGAEQLGRTQPSVSRTLTDLEKRLGQPLFEPRKRPLQPTELGRMLAAHGAEIAKASAAASESFETYREGRSGVVRIGGTPFFMDGVLSPVLADFQMQRPELRIDQSYAYRDDLFRSLDNGAIDLAICPIDAETAPAGYKVEKILPGRNVIAGRKGHPLFRLRSPTIDDLRGFTWIAPPTGSPLFEDLSNALAGLGVNDFKIVFTGGSLSSVLNFLANSDTLTVLPISVVFAQRHQFDVQAARIRINHPTRDLSIIEKSAASPTPAAKRLRRHVLAAFRTMAQSLAHHETNSLWKE